MRQGFRSSIIGRAGSVRRIDYKTYEKDAAGDAPLRRLTCAVEEVVVCLADLDVPAQGTKTRLEHG